MCGIAGKFDFRGNVVARALIESMCATIVHRGPDGEGIYTAPSIGLGQRRLAIIDLDDHAIAPLANEDESVWVTFNGEIYNFRELRAGLVARGHRFRTETDTEVLVHLYEEHGVDCVQKLRGMFAFAIWDSRAKRLLLARDRMGKKPLFYTRTADALIFGSKLSVITADPSVTIAPDYRAIDAYLTYQYVPSPLTAFEGIAKLPAGHVLVCDANGAMSVERYWAPHAAALPRATEQELEEEIVARLRDSVRMRLMSDVPLGAFLSGGIDSAAVVALMAQESGTVKTFSIGFDDEEDELPYARLVAERYGTDHHELVVRPDAASILPLLVEHYNEPFADVSALPTYYLSKMARESVTVALSGDGGDENFAGYESYRSVASWNRFDVMPRALRQLAAWPFEAAIDAMPFGRSSARAGRALAMFAGDTPSRFQLQMATFKPQEKAALYTDRFRALTGATASALALPWTRDMDPLAWMMQHDQTYYLADCLMVKVDVASMANGLEVRAPLLDHEFVEFAAAIPSSLKRTGGVSKAIFRRALAKLVPQAILEKKKMGFDPPVARWFRGALLPLVRETLLDGRAGARGLFEPAFVRLMVDEHVSGRRDWSNRLWALLVLELWFRRFIDAPRAAVVPAVAEAAVV
jgi:asparagine synthase (glutamine-hydrolysing)